MKIVRPVPCPGPEFTPVPWLGWAQERGRLRTHRAHTAAACALFFLFWLLGVQ
jgi:hypothetical protein